MSNPATVFRAPIWVRRDMLGRERDDRVMIPTAALNEQGAVTATWPNGITRSCVSCDHFKPAPGLEHCGLVNQRPPARIIAFGCERYSDDMDVPF